MRFIKYDGNDKNCNKRISFFFKNNPTQPLRFIRWNRLATVQTGHLPG